jgi:hypothetical protein
MSAVMTKKELDELETLANAATPGPWLAQGVLGRVMWICTDSGCNVVCAEDREMDFRMEDGEFIAAAREAIPRLIARVRELEAEIDAFWARIEE